MLENVKGYVEKLISLYESEKRRADGLSDSLSKSETEVESCRRQISELTRQLDNLKLQGALASTGAGPEAKQRLEKLIREIDKCIGLLEN